MTVTSFIRPLVVACMMAGSLTVPSEAQAPTLAMLDRLQSGEWEIRYREDVPTRRLCVRSGRDLLQLRHPNQSCNRFVVEDGDDMVTVQYTCRGDGYGRTSIRRESNGLVQIESQGIAGGRPFSFTAEGRRAGKCR